MTPSETCPRDPESFWVKQERERNNRGLIKLFLYFYAHECGISNVRGRLSSPPRLGAPSGTGGGTTGPVAAPLRENGALGRGRGRYRGLPGA